MASNSWHRPTSVPYPSTWSKFTKKMNNGTYADFEIKDITKELASECIQFMKTYFISDEPFIQAWQFHVYVGFMSDHTSIKEQVQWWEKILSENLSLVCLMKNSENIDADYDIAGVNILYYHHKIHDKEETVPVGETLKTVCNITKYIENQIDRYEILQTQEYLDEFGLCVHPKYRCLGVATEILKARENLCRAVGLNTTITFFTAIASQKAAKKANFQPLLEMEYTKLAKIFSPYTLNVINTPKIKYMYKNYV